MLDLDDPAFGRLFDRFADARVVLLGEASHGTSEFYRARAAITRRLIEEHGFTIVGVEADWPDAAYLDRLVRDRTHPDGVETGFPTVSRLDVAQHRRGGTSSAGSAIATARRSLIGTPTSTAWTYTA